MDYFNSTPTTLLRSQLHPAAYNPRTITKDGRKHLTRSIKKFGVVGGIVINKQTGYTIVGGHQKIAILDDLNKYDDSTHNNDYHVQCDLIDVDLRTEKSLNVALNNPNVGGEWDMEALQRIVPDIDYKDAGLTEADLSLIGVDYLIKTEQENKLADSLAQLNSPIQQERERLKQERQAERDAQDTDDADDDFGNMDTTPSEAEIRAAAEADRQQRIQKMKDLKKQVNDKAADQAANMDAYVVLSFDSFQAKADFCQQFGFGIHDKFIKGENFLNLLTDDEADDEDADEDISE